MTDRAELLEATLAGFPEGVALLDEDGEVVCWNHAAQAITGYSPADLVGKAAPQGLQALLYAGGALCHPEVHTEAGRGTLVHARHRLGHAVSAMARMLVLRDGLDKPIGAAVLFHSTECLEALPQGITGGDQGVEASQEDLKDQLESLFEDFLQGAPSFGVLWITVDQAHHLRRTHGAAACAAMLAKVEHALAQGLRPGERLGRWGEDEFLVINHERTTDLLADHARHLAALARTADFRWWGDRVSLTVSMGVAQARASETLAGLLDRARDAMLLSDQAGGNQIRVAPGGHTCSPS